MGWVLTWGVTCWRAWPGPLAGRGPGRRSSRMGNRSMCHREPPHQLLTELGLHLRLHNKHIQQRRCRSRHGRITPGHCGAGNRRVVLDTTRRCRGSGHANGSLKAGLPDTRLFSGGHAAVRQCRHVHGDPDVRFESKSDAVFESINVGKVIRLNWFEQTTLSAPAGGAPSVHWT